MRRPAFFMPEYWRSEGGIEGALLRSVFFGLLTAAIIMLGTDLHDMLQRSGEVSPDSERTDPVIVEPPKDSDQERPYFPKAMPLAPNTSPAQFPGVPVPTTPKMLASPMAFTLDDSGNVAAIGRIEPGTSARFDAFLKDVGVKAKRVWLNSPGGALADALSMGQAIRKAGLGTVVPANAYCASSCPLVFVGGVEREAGRKAWIGVHQAYTLPGERGTLGEGLEHAQRISADCQDHLVKMGVDPRAWIPAMRTPKTKIYVFTPKELVEYKLVTKPPTT
jgi:hypothetical protein